MTRTRRTPAAKQLPPLRPAAWSQAGRFCHDHDDRVWEVGYLLELPGISSHPFAGEPGLENARLTFAAEPVRVNLFDHWLETLTRPGRLTLYLQDPPGASYRDLASFRTREPIAIFERYNLERGRQITEDPEASLYVFTATLLWSRIFEIDGEIYDLREVVTGPLEQRIVGSAVSLASPRTRERLRSHLPAAETESLQSLMLFTGQARLRSKSG